MNVAAAISISSNALLMLGDTTISSFTQGTTGSTVAANLYETSLRALLSSHRWRFATKKVQLARLTATPLNDYTYQFQLPTDFIMLIKLQDSSDFEIYGDKLYSNQSTAYIDYIYRVDETYFPPWFTKTLEFFLAAQFAIPVTGNSTRMQEYNGMYEMQMRRARFADSSERPNIGIQDNPFTDIRA